MTLELIFKKDLGVYKMEKMIWWDISLEPVGNWLAKSPPIFLENLKSYLVSCVGKVSEVSLIWMTSSLMLENLKMNWREAGKQK